MICSEVVSFLLSPAAAVNVIVSRSHALWAMEVCGEVKTTFLYTFIFPFPPFVSSSLSLSLSFLLSTLSLGVSIAN